jgi:hypothetical protein
MMPGHEHAHRLLPYWKPPRSGHGDVHRLRPWRRKCRDPVRETLRLCMEHSPILPFVLMLAAGASVAAVIGLQMLCGFVAGVLVTLAAAAIAGTDFD